MKFENKVSGKFTDDVNESLRKLISTLNEKASALVQKETHDYTLFALRALASYTGTLFERLISHEDFPIEYNAISARNLFESYLLVAYITGTPSKGKEFLSQKAFDEIEINEGFLALKIETTSKASIKAIRDRIHYIKELMKENDFTPSKHWTVSYLAQQTNNKVEYEAFFKLYSKYIHPSSWIVNSINNEYDNPVFKDIFISQGYIFTNRIIQLISKYQDQQTIA
ncbi:DUF5677 domain-containing protein [Paraflavitalea sp. CAU 1676]|uniref:DUF5677 domain-containing protein n=1 Tax=Paraflavitalea sp. CAU 1676 TaxID=3032598 RepID=UPI0023DCC267|nr:DUF5677 domain-containing protein [Paraflavitalea sp. CAU 1676]MDF2188538.1 DUF5677 domain-containing protein [Paraflavitalea sp. CAU 1676]